MNPPATAAATAGRPISGTRRSVLRLASDDALVRRVGAGDADAFGEVFRRYHQPLYRYCAGLIGDGDDARDALQNTMARAMIALTGVTREIALRPWLYRIAHHESINLVRRRRLDLELDDSAPAPGPTPEDAAVVAESWRDLRDDLAALPERQRGALLLRELAGLGPDEIGVAMGTTPAAASQAVHEARESLRASAVGRDTACASVRMVLDEGDGRRLKSRTIRGHLRSCPSCREQAAALRLRRRVLPVIVPVLPAAVAARLLESLQAHDPSVVGAVAGGGAGAAGGLVLGGGAGAGVGTLGSGLASPAVVGMMAVVAAGGGALAVGGGGAQVAPPPPPGAAVERGAASSRPTIAAPVSRPWAAGGVAGEHAAAVAADGRGKRRERDGRRGRSGSGSGGGTGGLRLARRTTGVGSGSGGTAPTASAAPVVPSAPSATPPVAALPMAADGGREQRSERSRGQSGGSAPAAPDPRSSSNAGAARSGNGASGGLRSRRGTAADGEGSGGARAAAPSGGDRGGGRGDARSRSGSGPPATSPQPWRRGRSGGPSGGPRSDGRSRAASGADGPSSGPGREGGDRGRGHGRRDR